MLACQNDLFRAERGYRLYNFDESLMVERTTLLEFLRRNELPRLAGEDFEIVSNPSSPGSAEALLEAEASGVVRRKSNTTRAEHGSRV